MPLNKKRVDIPIKKEIRWTIEMSGERRSGKSVLAA